VISLCTQIKLCVIYNHAISGKSSGMASHSSIFCFRSSSTRSLFLAVGNFQSFSVSLYASGPGICTMQTWISIILESLKRLPDIWDHRNWIFVNTSN
jgi:hypothetical protein